jgi:hypothetical protein
MPIVLFIGVKRGFGGRQRKNEPAVAGIDRGEFENVAKELAVGFGVFGVDNNVSAGEYDGLRSKGTRSTFRS